MFFFTVDDFSIVLKGIFRIPRLNRFQYAVSSVLVMAILINVTQKMEHVL